MNSFYLICALGILVGLLGTEFFSIFVHRFLFHGPLWFIHHTHHSARTGFFEWNDLFSFGFGAVAVAFIWLGYGNNPLLLGTGWGITLYGLFYFIIHDGFVHRRIPTASFNARYLQAVRSWHRTHHQKSTKDGQGPYGLFIPY